MAAAALARCTPLRILVGLCGRPLALLAGVGLAQRLSNENGCPAHCAVDGEDHEAVSRESVASHNEIQHRDRRNDHRKDFGILREPACNPVDEQPADGCTKKLGVVGFIDHMPLPAPAGLRRASSYSGGHTLSATTYWMS